jgi:hypothetical protein
MSPREQRLLLGSAVGSSALMLLAALLGHAEVLAYLAPVLVVALPLIAGRYLGEERLERLRSRVVRPRARRVAGTRTEVRRSPVLAPRGGRLLAHALAERGPPVAALT